MGGIHAVAFGRARCRLAARLSSEVATAQRAEYTAAGRLLLEFGFH